MLPDADITRARTPDPEIYRSTALFERARERVFATSWQWLGTLDDVATPESLAPRELLPGLLDEPLLLARDAAGTLRCLSNVCTHRANLLVRDACHAREIRCGYHSRRFDLAGRMTFMPEFQGVQGFPAETDHLPVVPFAAFQGHGFASLAPVHTFEAWIAPVAARMPRWSLDTLLPWPERSRDFTVAAHWALYVENYLEGFHIPFVHGGLARDVDYDSYATELFDHAVLQVARARDPAHAFAPGELGGDDATQVAALYWWLFPNLILNFYPWGLSLNVVLPRSPGETRVLFRSFVHDSSRLGNGAGASLDRVEAEDEAIVEAVQRGVNSRLYRGGRYSPSREGGVHRFHRLLAAGLGCGA